MGVAGRAWGLGCHGRWDGGRGDGGRRGNTSTCPRQAATWDSRIGLSMARDSAAGHIVATHGRDMLRRAVMAGHVAHAVCGWVCAWRKKGGRVCQNSEDGCANAT